MPSPNLQPQSLTTLQRWLSGIFDHAPINVYIKDMQGRYLWVNKTFERTFGVVASRVIGQPPRHLDDQLRNRADSHDMAVIEQNRAIEQIEQFEGRFLKVLKCPLRDENGSPNGIIGFDVDVTELHMARQSLAEHASELRRINRRLLDQLEDERGIAAELLHQERDQLETVLESIGDGVLATDSAGIVSYINPAACAVCGCSRADAIGHPATEVYRTFTEPPETRARDPVIDCLVSSRPVTRTAIAVLDPREGPSRDIRETVAPLRDAEGGVRGVVVVFADVTEQHRLQRTMEYQASHDELTGLVNRREFERRLERILADEGDGDGDDVGAEHAVTYMDLDAFKVVNDTCGHYVGDALLGELAELFRSKVRKRDTLARLGGDEFGILMEHCPPDQAERVARELLDELSRFRFEWPPHRFRIGASIGLVPIKTGPTSIDKDEVMRAADSACYVAKEAGTNRLHVHREDDDETSRRSEELRLVTRLHDALEHDAFRLDAQPIIALTPGAPEKLRFEVLVRLDDGRGNGIEPRALIAAAERYKLAPRLDQWVARTTISRLATLHARGMDLGICAINLSGQSVGDDGLRDTLGALLEAHPELAPALCFEITETAAIANLPRAIAFIRAVKHYGCSFALDDVGTGVASFAHVKALPVDYLKVDGEFVRRCAHDEVDSTIVGAIARIAQLTDKACVAEGVESERTLKVLAEIGVDYAQGYALGRPRPLEALLAETG